MSETLIKVYKDLEVTLGGVKIPCHHKWQDIHKYKPTENQQFILVCRDDGCISVVEYIKESESFYESEINGYHNESNNFTAHMNGTFIAWKYIDKPSFLINDKYK